MPCVTFSTLNFAREKYGAPAWYIYNVGNRTFLARGILRRGLIGLSVCVVCSLTLTLGLCLFVFSSVCACVCVRRGSTLVPRHCGNFRISFLKNEGRRRERKNHAGYRFLPEIAVFSVSVSWVDGAFHFVLCYMLYLSTRLLSILGFEAYKC